MAVTFSHNCTCLERTRCLFEDGRSGFLLSDSPRRQSHPLGRYHPVLVVPGLAALEQRLDIARDKSRARLIAQIDPRPSRENHEAITKADQIEDVDEQPSDPGDKTAEPKPSNLCDYWATANS